VRLRLRDAFVQALRRTRARARGEQHVKPGQTLERLVVQLARPACALGLGRLKPFPGSPLARIAKRRLHALAFALVREDDHGARATGAGHGGAPVVHREARAVAAPEAVHRQRLEALGGTRAVDGAVLARVRRAVGPRVMEELVGRLPDELLRAPAEHLRRGGICERDDPAPVHVVDAVPCELQDAVMVAGEPFQIVLGQVQRGAPR
jgi:hypothetical protein